MNIILIFAILNFIMNKQNQLLDFTQIEEISGGDAAFKKELIEIFATQIPDFIKNMTVFFESKDLESLAREAHTAKSSALIFGMKETGEMLKMIQNLAESNSPETIPALVAKVNSDLGQAQMHLTEEIKHL